ncbi:hypothetical protein [Chryseobacterium carnipullorum]|uniref:hypothetical protein n=1 Tax=Chryseobacterium carnipullorum TaxID=1124835 RepID=UPI0013DE1DDA|nr:hypothetical protein [Chryseobacterium carnipullorum]
MSMYYYGHKKDDQPIISKLLDLAARYPTRDLKLITVRYVWKMCFGTEKEFFVFIEILI